jgi:hypothetical protein
MFPTVSSYFDADSFCKTPSLLEAEAYNDTGIRVGFATILLLVGAS